MSKRYPFGSSYNGNNKVFQSKADVALFTAALIHVASVVFAAAVKAKTQDK